MRESIWAIQPKVDSTYSYIQKTEYNQKLSVCAMVYNTLSCTLIGCIQKMECNLWLIQPMGEWHNFEASDPHQWKMTPPWENESSVGNSRDYPTSGN